ncbi:hypothetical protein SAMN05444000_1333 [Shimia gijangensis]|uniref:Uncharacterized protein n=1 Tax=Shimia gijangensis TaxID=1470563 RepID=A0A1M6SWQ2_9RHOB|nr:hypothetical protein [Shimia gijangensis]SHK49145.1 hypothetical protein SAMN05444000_1333 [Shimia gijangensis]
MMVPNTDLLRAVSKYDASGRPRPGYFPDYRMPVVKQRGDQRGSLASLIQFFLLWTQSQQTLKKAGHR